MLTNQLFGAIGAAGKSPYALVAYGMATAAWLIVAWRVQRHKILLEHIKDLPPSDRLAAIRAEMGLPSTANELNAEQFMKARVQFFFLIAYLCTAGVVLVISVVAYMDFGKVSAVMQ
jgi:hypothetical protein